MSATFTAATLREVRLWLIDQVSEAHADVLDRIPSPLDRSAAIQVIADVRLTQARPWAPPLLEAADAVETGGGPRLLYDERVDVADALRAVARSVDAGL
jgi:hypothetical protein